MAPLPKPPGQRRRRNTSQAQWRGLPAAGRTGSAPRLPYRKPAWLKATREWWETIWASPMATAWLPADVPALMRLAALVELVNRGETGVLSEIRQLEDRFGLSPRSRRQLQWEIVAGAGVADEEAAEQQPPRKLADVRRLRAVDAAG